MTKDSRTSRLDCSGRRGSGSICRLLSGCQLTMTDGTLSQALPESGCLVTIDRDERAVSMARRFWEEAGVSVKVWPPCTLSAPSALYYQSGLI